NIKVESIDRSLMEENIRKAIRQLENRIIEGLAGEYSVERIEELERRRLRLSEFNKEILKGSDQDSSIECDKTSGFDFSGFNWSPDSSSNSFSRLMNSILSKASKHNLSK